MVNKASNNSETHALITAFLAHWLWGLGTLCFLYLLRAEVGSHFLLYPEGSAKFLPYKVFQLGFQLVFIVGKGVFCIFFKCF